MRLCLLSLSFFVVNLAFAQHTQFGYFPTAPSYAAYPKQLDTARYSNEYLNSVGGKLSVGIAFDEGFGIPVRYYWTPKNVVEAGMYIGSTLLLHDDDVNDPEFYLPSGPQFAIAYCRLGDKFEKAKRRKSKIRALGLTPRIHYQFPTGSDNTFSKTQLSLGFTQETYKGLKHNRNYVFEIGPYYRNLKGSYEGIDFTGTDFGLYLRFNWNWFLE